jgi:hypothetical protein
MGRPSGFAFLSPGTCHDFPRLSLAICSSFPAA